MQSEKMSGRDSEEWREVGLGGGRELCIYIFCQARIWLVAFINIKFNSTMVEMVGKKPRCKCNGIPELVMQLRAQATPISDDWH